MTLSVAYTGNRLSPSAFGCLCDKMLLVCVFVGIRLLLVYLLRLRVNGSVPVRPAIPSISARLSIYVHFRGQSTCSCLSRTHCGTARAFCLDADRICRCNAAHRSEMSDCRSAIPPPLYFPYLILGLSDAIVVRPPSQSNHSRTG